MGITRADDPTEQRLQALADVQRQMAANDERWGVGRRISDLLWGAVLVEEVGEVAEHLYLNVASDTLAALRDELVDVAAVAVAMIEAIDDDRWVETPADKEHPALAGATIITRALGTYAKRVLQREDAKQVALALNDLAFTTLNVQYEITVAGYTPRAVEGAADEAAVRAEEEARNA